MKLFTKLTLILFICLATSAGYSQTSHTAKAKIFANYPDRVNCSPLELSNAISATDGQHVNLFFSNNFKFSGTVINNVVKYSNLQTMTIRSDDEAQTIFQLSKRINDDNTVSYVGRILNANAADGYEIRKDVTGNYSLQKLETETVLQECNL